VVKSQPIDLNLGHRSSYALLNAPTENIYTRYGYKDRSNTYKGKGVEKLVVYPRNPNKTPRTHANSPRAEKTATATTPSKKMGRDDWNNFQRLSGLAENIIHKGQRYVLICSVCNGTGHISHKCPWKPFFDKNGKCKNPWETTNAEKLRTKRKFEPAEDKLVADKAERVRSKRQHGLNQHKAKLLVKSAPHYQKIEQDTTKVFCEDDYSEDDWKINRKTGAPLMWREATTKPIKSEVIDIAAGFNANSKSGDELKFRPAVRADDEMIELYELDEAEWRHSEARRTKKRPTVDGEKGNGWYRVENVEDDDEPCHIYTADDDDEWHRNNEMYGDVDEIPVPPPVVKPSNVIEHDSNDEIKVGRTWEWMDDDDTTSWACKMEKLDSTGWGPFRKDVVLPKPTTDKRPDQYRGADMVHKEPTYSLIRYTRTPALFGLPVWFSKTIDLVVSEEVATQVLTASNVNYCLGPDSIFNRIVQSAKSVSKVNEDRYMVLNGYHPRNDTIIFANNIAKCYFWDRRELKSGVDFTRCQDTTKPK